MLPPFIIVLFYVVLFSTIIYYVRFFHPTGINKSISIILFNIKAAISIFFGYYYFHYAEGGDTFSFFENSKIITGLAYTDPISFIKIVSGLGDHSKFAELYRTIGGWHTFDAVYNDSRTIIKINAILGLISFGNYYVHAIFFAFFSFIGSIGLFNFFRLMSHVTPQKIIVPVFLIPSVLFWTSGANKEGILILVMGLTLYQFANIVNAKNKFLPFIYFTLFSFIFIFIKAYILVLLIPSLIALAWSNKNLHLKCWMKYITIYLFFFLAIFFFATFEIPTAFAC